MDTSSQEFYARVEEVVQREVAEGGLEPELPSLHPRNPSPFEIVRWCSSSSVEGTPTVHHALSTTSLE